MPSIVESPAGHDQTEATFAKRFKLFHGAWSVRRSIVDLRNGLRSSFEGAATITPDRFEENGEMLSGGARLKSARMYRLAYSDSGVSVRFADARDFVEIGDGALQPLLHHCGEDIYDGRLAFLTINRWVEIWRVSGPRKDYRSFATYRRA